MCVYVCVCVMCVRAVTDRWALKKKKKRNDYIAFKRPKMWEERGAVRNFAWSIFNCIAWPWNVIQNKRKKQITLDETLPYIYIYILYIYQVYILYSAHKICTRYATRARALGFYRCAVGFRFFFLSCVLFLFDFFLLEVLYEFISAQGKCLFNHQKNVLAS